MLNVKKSRQGAITQANTLVRSRQNLSMMQKRLFYIAMEAVRRADVEFKELVLPVPALRDLVGGHYGSFKEKLREAAQPLVGTTLNIHRKSGSWASISIFQTIEYLHAGEVSESGFRNEQSCDIIRMKLHDDLKAYLLKIDGGFNTLAFKYVLNFNYPRSHKLFELLHHESWGGEHKTIVFDRDELAEYLEMDGSYSKFRDYRRALDRLCVQIQELTPMRVTYEGKRLGRSIKRIEFSVSFDDTAPVQGSLEIGSDPEKTLEEIELANVLRKLGYTQDPFTLLENHGLEVVQNAVQVTRAAVKKSPAHRPISNPGGFLSYLLNNGVAIPEKEGGTQEQFDELLHDLKDAYDQAYVAFFEEVWEGLSETDKAGVLEGLRRELEPFELKLIEKSGWQGPAFRGVRNRHLLAQHISALPEQLQSATTFVVSRLPEVEKEMCERLAEVLSYELALS